MHRRLTVAATLALGLGLVPWTAAAQGYSGASTVPEQKADTQVEALQDHIQAQPEMMDAIRALQSDPTFQDVLSDPEIVRALESGNTAALLTNPKINHLAEHPAVQDLTKKLGQ
jgi:hypothetical protein